MPVSQLTLPFTVAEVGMNHDGSLGSALSYIEALSSTGVSAIKFQMHIPEAESSSRERFRVKVFPQDHTRYDYWERTRFTKKQWAEIKKACDDAGVIFFATPFSVAAVDLLAELGVNIWKIPSGEITNWYLFDAILEKHGEIFMSSGMSSIRELDSAVDYIRAKDGQISTVLQCTSAYPVEPKDLGLNVMTELSQRYNTLPGLSDHSGRTEANTIASYLGCEVFEFHVRKSSHDFGPDIPASINVGNVTKLIDSINYAKKLSQRVEKDDIFDRSAVMRETFFPKLVAKRTLVPGHRISKEDLEPRKGEGGVTVSKLNEVIGRVAKVEIHQGVFLEWDSLSDG